ncbi:MAG: hypothetical protein LBN34_09495 [Clostridiales Family XIII bacterium]|jgi:hypothetical protein|nr:hypothetical protein [Clostridiales Family XIII bacterium]
MGFFRRKKEGPTAVVLKGADKGQVAPETIAAITAAVRASEAPDDSIVAAITAAVRAYEAADEFSSGLNIRKLNRAAGIRPAWGIAGTTDAIRHRQSAMIRRERK